ncbi:hypothetical protein N9E38_01995 [Yoonia sp.]|nr:hypothetical protein [Yoonia sp.]
MTAINDVGGGNLLRAVVLALVASSGSIATAQEMPLGDYLASMDRAEITFSGQIQYDDRQDEFTFYDEDLGLFSVTVDAGREVRERIEEECSKGPFFSRTNSCTISGRGTVEIRGAEIAISVETVDELLSAEADTSEEDIASALEATLGATSAGSDAPPMTGAERDAFRLAVNRCWNIDPSTAAARVTVEVVFNLDREGRVTGDVRLLSSQGAQSAITEAFEAAKRAILRCQSEGYQLPADKYDQWEEVVITFDPSGMRLR